MNLYGRIYLKYANSAISALNSGQKALDASKKGTYPRIVLNAQLGIDSLVPLVTSFLQAYSGIELFVRKDGAWIASTTDYDLQLISCPSDVLPPKTSITLFEEDLVLAVPNGHHLEGNLFVNLEDLQNEQFVMFESMSVYRKAMERYCQQAGFTPYIAAEGYDRQMICEFIRANMGVSIVPKQSWKSLLSDLTLIPIHNPHCSRRIIISWISDNRLTTSSELFIKHAIQYYQNATNF